VAKTRTVCTEVEVEVVETATASSSSDKGVDEWSDDDWGGDDWGGDKGSSDSGGDWGGDSGGGKGGKRRLNSMDEQFVRNVDTSLSLKDRLTVKIIAGKSDDEETVAETQSYSWSIESVS